MKAIIFDFDGVIIDSMGIKSEAFAHIYSKYGKDIKEKVVAHHQSNGGMSRYKKFKLYHKEFLNIELTDEEIKVMDKQFSEFVMSKISDAPFVKGILDFLEQNKKYYKFFISSGTPQYELNQVVKLLGIEHYFERIFGSPDNKEKHIEMILKEYFFHPKTVLFIGDGTYDKKAANATNLNFLARIANENSLLMNEEFKIDDFTEANDIIALIDAKNSIA